MGSSVVGHGLGLSPSPSAEVTGQGVELRVCPLVSLDLSGWQPPLAPERTGNTL